MSPGSHGHSRSLKLSHSVNGLDRLNFNLQVRVTGGTVTDSARRSRRQFNRQLDNRDGRVPTVAKLALTVAATRVGDRALLLFESLAS
jgi:hypothetical protein